MSEVVRMLQEAITKRCANVGDDVLSGLITGDFEQADGSVRKLTDVEIFSYCRLIMFAGGGTTWRQLGITLKRSSPIGRFPCAPPRDYFRRMANEFHAFVVELLRPLGLIRIKRMFGGAGVYLGEGPMFGLIADDTLYLKVDAALKAELSQAGSGPFAWTPTSGPHAGKSMDLGYWRMPDDALDNPELACIWASLTRKLRKSKARPAKKGKGRPSNL